ncbi:MAG: UbiX family flavin prenyltransferase [Thermoplasmata archaeon]|nr:UbiX family flavin prenyltransferase [Thermoplasmata archaeon]
MKIVVGITGASGIVYAINLLKALKGKAEVHLIISDSAEHLLEAETDMSPGQLEGLAGHIYNNHDFNQGLCSGSFLFDAMVIIPCTMSTLAKLSNGIADNVMTRAGAVALKERRTLVVVPRETPLSTINLKTMYELSLSGGIVLPAMPGFYNKPESIEELLDFISARILDLLGIENRTSKRWG